MKKVRDMAFPKGEQVAVGGMTRHGKTYAVIKTLENEKKGAFLFNTLHTPTSNKFIKADRKTDLDLIYKALREGKKVDYLPSSDDEQFSQELKLFIQNLYSQGSLDFRFAIDEVHLFHKPTQKAINRICTTGLRYGYQMVFISQRPALIDNTLLSQCTQMYFFNLNTQDRKYLEGYKFPVDDMMDRIDNEKYRYVTFDQRKVEGAYMVEG